MLKKKGMNTLFAPFSGESPVPVCINGHRLIIVSGDAEQLTENLELLGGDRVERVSEVESDAEQEQVIAQLAEENRSGVIVAPDNVKVFDLLQSLEHQLPWLQ